MSSALQRCSRVVELLYIKKLWEDTPEDQVTAGCEDALCRPYCCRTQPPTK